MHSGVGERVIVRPLIGKWVPKEKGGGVSQFWAFSFMGSYLLSPFMFTESSFALLEVTP